MSISEEDLVYLGAQACPALERFLNGDSPFVGGVDVGGQVSLLPVIAPQGQQEGMEEPFPGLRNRIASEPPPLEGTETDDGTRLDGRVGPSGEDVHDTGQMPWGVIPEQGFVEADSNLTAMQEEYLSLGCGSSPAPKTCKDSKYARYIEQELNDAISK